MLKPWRNNLDLKESKPWKLPGFDLSTRRKSKNLKSKSKNHEKRENSKFQNSSIIKKKALQSRVELAEEKIA